MSEYKTGLGFHSAEMQAIYRMTSNEAYVSITSDRKITVEPDSYVAGVVGDHNSNPVRIRFDRYVDGGDLSTCNRFYVAWQNPTAQTSGRCEIDTVTEDPDNAAKLLCVWLVDYLVCGNPGLLEITFQAVREDNEGGILYEWQTKLDKSMKVLDGIDPSYASTYSDETSAGGATAEWYIDEAELTAMLTEVLV